MNSISPDPVKTKNIRKKYNIDDDTFLWLMSGTMDVNKDPSIFVDIANNLLRETKNIRFIWLIGGNEDNGYVTFCKNKATELGIGEKIIWAENLNHEGITIILMLVTVSYLLQQKESFSMVTVEALYLGKRLLLLIVEV